MNTHRLTLRPHHLASILLINAICCATASAQNTQATFEQLVAKKATDDIVELWKKSPFETLPTIDSYLEGSLKLVETSATPDTKAIGEMHAKALIGAAAADKAFGSVIFSEYASSFASWNRRPTEAVPLGTKSLCRCQSSNQG